MTGRKKYDLVCSLGGNCSVAHNLIFRGLRKFALPFEWAFLDDIKICNLENSKIITIRKIKKGIKISLIPNISTIFRFKLYFIGIRFDLLIGKERE